MIFSAQVLIDADDVGHVFDAFLANGTAQYTPVRLALRSHVNQPDCLAALIGHQAEEWRLAQQGTQHFHAHRVAVGAKSEDRIAGIDRRRLAPSDEGTLFGTVTDFRQVAHAAANIHPTGTESRMHVIEFRLQRQALEDHQLLFLIRLDSVQIERTGIDGVGCVGFQTCVSALRQEINNRLERGGSEERRRVRVAAEINELLCAEQLAVANHRLHQLGHHLTLFSVHHVLLFLGQLHLVWLGRVVRG